VEKARNDLSGALPKFCLALEEHRRTQDGRVRTSQEFLTAFFPYEEKTSSDRIFKHLPNEVRGPIIAAWGVRGIKAALRDDDEKVQGVIHDALVAGDIDHTAFEEGLAPETLVRWVPLAEIWTFWRGGKLTKQAIQKALTAAYDLALFDARWFLETIQSKGGSLKGTDVLADSLNKDELVGWIKRIHESGDGTPKGLVTALGWEKIAAKTRDEALVAVLDAMVAKAGLVAAKESGASASIHPEKDRKSAADAASEAPSPGQDKLPIDGSWESMRPTPSSDTGPDEPEVRSAPLSTEEAINIVLEDELIIPEASTPSPNPAIGAAPIKDLHKDPFPARGKRG
jgi:hypothetical protein